MRNFLKKFKVGSAEGGKSVLRKGASPSPYNTTLHEAVGGDACIAPQAAARLCGPMTSIGPYKKA